MANDSLGPIPAHKEKMTAAPEEGMPEAPALEIAGAGIAPAPSWVGWFIQPLRVDRRRLETPWIVLGLLLLALLAAASLPPVQDYIWRTDGFGLHEWARSVEHRELAKRWLESLSICFEILSAVFLGEALLGEHFAHTIRDEVTRIQDGVARAFRGEVDALEQACRDLTEANQELARQLIQDIVEWQKQQGKIGWSRTLRLMWRVALLTRRVYVQVPWVVRRLGSVTLLTSFPGGLPGLLTFVAFGLLTCCKVAHLFLDSYPAVR